MEVGVLGTDNTDVYVLSTDDKVTSNFISATLDWNYVWFRVLPCTTERLAARFFIVSEFKLASHRSAITHNKHMQLKYSSIDLKKTAHLPTY